MARQGLLSHFIGITLQFRLRESVQSFLRLQKLKVRSIYSFLSGVQRGWSPWPQKPSNLVTETSPNTWVWQAKRRGRSPEWGGSDRRVRSRQFAPDTSPSTCTAQVPQVPIPRQLINFDWPLYTSTPWANSTWRKLAPLSQVISWPAALIFTIIYIFSRNSVSTIFYN